MFCSDGNISRMGGCRFHFIEVGSARRRHVQNQLLGSEQEYWTRAEGGYYKFKFTSDQWFQSRLHLYHRGWGWDWECWKRQAIVLILLLFSEDLTFHLHNVLVIHVWVVQQHDQELLNVVIRTYAHVQYNIIDSLWVSRLCIAMRNHKFYEGGSCWATYIVRPLELDMEFLIKYNISLYTSGKRAMDWYRLLMIQWLCYCSLYNSCA